MALEDLFDRGFGRRDRHIISHTSEGVERDLTMCLALSRDVAGSKKVEVSRFGSAVDIWIATQFTRIMRTELPCEIRDVLPNFPAQFSRELLYLTFERAPVDTAAQSLAYVRDVLCQLAGRWRGVRRSRAVSATGPMESG